MSPIKYSNAAILDIKRLHDFLAKKDITIAKRAISIIRTELQKIATFPERFRPVEDMIYHREAIIEFGNSGYVARFRHLPNGEIIIIRIKHQLENNNPE